ncbi:MAG: hypothetical protein ABSC64_02440 [Candidatus Korobacteraceae bacterium]
MKRDSLDVANYVNYILSEREQLKCTIATLEDDVELIGGEYQAARKKVEKLEEQVATLRIQLEYEADKVYELEEENKRLRLAVALDRRTYKGA